MPENAPMFGSLFSGIPSADSILASNALGGDARGSASKTPTPALSSRNTGPVSPAIPTSESSTGASPRSISSAGDSPARISALLGNGPASTGLGADCGLSSREPLAYFDRALSSWRTCQGSLLPGSDVFSETWPRAGTMRNGTVFPRRPSVRRTFVTASLSWPTPRSCSAMGATITAAALDKAPDRFPNLETVVAMREGSRAIGGQLNPQWIEWLMGFPPEWTALDVWETRSSRRLLNGSANKSSRRGGKKRDG
jgi:hypothetical protein